MNDLLKQIKENSNKLENCKLHDFEFPKKDGKIIPMRKRKCVNCGGEADSSYIMAYYKGLKDSISTKLDDMKKVIEKYEMS